MQDEDLNDVEATKKIQTRLDELTTAAQERASAKSTPGTKKRGRPIGVQWRALVLELSQKHPKANARKMPIGGATAEE